jgi:hypothetical protein
VESKNNDDDDDVDNVDNGPYQPVITSSGSKVLLSEENNFSYDVECIQFT